MNRIFFNQGKISTRYLKNILNISTVNIVGIEKIFRKRGGIK